MSTRGLASYCLYLSHPSPSNALVWAERLMRKRSNVSKALHSRIGRFTGETVVLRLDTTLLTHRLGGSGRQEISFRTARRYSAGGGAGAKRALKVARSCARLCDTRGGWRKGNFIEAEGRLASLRFMIFVCVASSPKPIFETRLVSGNNASPRRTQQLYIHG